MDYCYKLTTNGRAVLAACMDLGRPLRLTRAAVGGGRIPEDANLADQHDLIQYAAEAAIADRRHQEDRLFFTVQYSGGSREAGMFFLSEFMVWAEDPETGRETDLLYATLGDYRQPVPAGGEGFPASVWAFPVVMVVSGDLEVSVTASPGLVTWEDLEDFRAGVSLPLEAHNADPKAHPDIRERIGENAAAIEGIRRAALSAGETARTADEKADRALAAAAAAEETAQTAQNAADAALKTITKIAYTIEIVPTQNGSLTYTGQEQSPAWNSFNAAAMTVGGTVKAANAGTYNAVFTPKEGYTWSDGTAAAKTVSWTIRRAVIASVPAQSGALAYTGSAQSPAWSNYDAGKMALGGAASGTDAGTYSASFTPNGNYQWGDGSTGAKTVPWSIQRAVIPAVPAQSGTLTYSGAEQAPSWSNYSAARLTIGGTTKAVNAGSYSASFTPTANYRWSDGTAGAKSASWTIRRASLAVPAQRGALAYTGSAQSPAWNNYDATKMTLGGTTGGTNAGTYYASFSLTANYQWSDGATGAKSVAWTIGKAAGSLSLNKTSLSLSISTMSGTIAVTRAGNGTISASSSNTAVAAVSVSGTTVTVTAKAKGSATITVSVAAGSNHTAPANKTCSVSVNLPARVLNENSWSMIKEVSDAGQGGNYWSVGDTKQIVINGKVGKTTFSNLAIDAFIIGFNHNASKEGTNRIHFQIGKINGKMVGLCDEQYGKSTESSGYFNMNTSATTSGGWKSCSMRQALLGNLGTPSSPRVNSLLAALPSDLRAVMKPVTKYTDNIGNPRADSNVSATTDYLFLLSNYEVFGGTGAANSNEKNFQLQYDYYKAGNSKIAYNHSATTKAVSWYLRSVFFPGSINSIGFCSVAMTGVDPAYGTTIRLLGANEVFALVPCFAV
ncbi:MAG: hypothetical protein HFG08_09845 [Oscillibacter sp.]|nr:hypothetical protein [Oscillibacter sp.]